MSDRFLAAFCHIGAFFSTWLLPGIGGVLLPLLVGGVFARSDRPLLASHYREALNFQLSMLLYFVITLLLLLLGLVFTGLVPFFTTAPDLGLLFGSTAVVISLAGLLGLLFVFELFCVIVATVRAFDGAAYRYPLTIRFVRPSLSK